MIAISHESPSARSRWAVRAGELREPGARRDDEVRADEQLAGRLRLDDLDVRDHAARARARELAPDVGAGQPGDAVLEPAAIVEGERDLGGRSPPPASSASSTGLGREELEPVLQPASSSSRASRNSSAVQASRVAASTGATARRAPPRDEPAPRRTRVDVGRVARRVFELSRRRATPRPGRRLGLHQRLPVVDVAPHRHLVGHRGGDAAVRSTSGGPRSRSRDSSSTHSTSGIEQAALALAEVREVVRLAEAREVLLRAHPAACSAPRAARQTSSPTSRIRPVHRDRAQGLDLGFR